MKLRTLVLGAFLWPWLSFADDSARIIREQLYGNEHNITHLNTFIAPPWVPPPIYRGSASILWSCIVTLTACAYTALHLNVPNRTGWRSQLFAKLKWVMIGIFIPEATITMAGTQFMEARWLSQELTKLQKSDPTVDQEVGTSILPGGRW